MLYYYFMQYIAIFFEKKMYYIGIYKERIFSVIILGGISSG
ncbi:hypothetical protein B481_3546 [Planococcus halocryophilus Or1]|nr:hypothetical protein B481_3546 [Planococcus halocryophilus Or1]